MRIALTFSVLCWIWHMATADDFLQLVVVGKGTGSDAALADMAQDKAALASDFVSAEGPSYKLVATGESLPVARKLGAAKGRRLPDLGCPNGCANSNSPKCIALGCAFCGKCGGRRQLRDGSSSNNKNIRSRGRSLEQLRTASEQRQIESSLGSDLAQYCDGKEDCALYAKVLRLYSNGTVVRAN